MVFYSGFAGKEKNIKTKFYLSQSPQRTQRKTMVFVPALPGKKKT